MSVSTKENFLYCLTTITRFFKTVCNDKQLLTLNRTIKSFDERYCHSELTCDSIKNTAKKRFNSDIITRWLFLELQIIEEIIKLDPYNVLYLEDYTNGIGKPISFDDINNDENLLCFILLIRLNEYMKSDTCQDWSYRSFGWTDKLTKFYKDNIKQ